MLSDESGIIAYILTLLSLKVSKTKRLCMQKVCRGFEDNK
jgi:hypothetical protein